LSIKFKLIMSHKILLKNIIQAQLIKNIINTTIGSHHGRLKSQ
jgi:hypothetical protein